MTTVLKKSLSITLSLVMILSALAIIPLTAQSADDGKTETFRSPQESRIEESDTVAALYFTNNKYWDSVKDYLWKEEGDEKAQWPGEAATYIGENDFNEGIYCAKVDTDLYDHVIFNGGGGMTVDIDVYEAVINGGGVYCLDTQDENGHYNVCFYEFFLTVSWVNDDGTVLEFSDDVRPGSVPAYHGETPEKEADDEYTYTFSGWTDGENNYGLNDQLPRSYTHKTYTATFEATAKSASASFVKVTEEPDDWSGDYLIVYEDEEGSTAFNSSYDDLDAAGNYIEVTINNGEIAFDDDTDAAKVTIAQIDGGYSIKTADDLYIGGRASSNKTVISDEAILNTISLDDDDYAQIVSNTAVFLYNLNWSGFRYCRSATQHPVCLYKLEGTCAPTYTVTWENWDGTVLETDEDVEEGAIPSYDGAEPEKEEDDEYTYAFSGWTDGENDYGPDDELPEVTASVTYTATFAATAKVQSESTFYVVGSFTEWQPDDSYRMTKNTEAEGEYYLFGVMLMKDDQLKVIETNDGIQDFETVWYPAGMGNDYVVSVDGIYDIYFRPNYDGGDDWYYNCIYLADATPDLADVERFIEMIDALPSADEVTEADRDAVEAAREAYDALSDTEKQFVNDEYLEKLEALEEALILPLTNESYLENNVTEVKVGEEVAIIGAASGGKGPYTFAFYYKKASGNYWTPIETDADTAVLKVSTVNSYKVKIRVTDSKGAAADKVIEVTSVPVNLVNNSTISSTSVLKNTEVVITGQASGGEGDYSFAFYYKKSTSSAWTKIGEPYSGAAEASFTPAMTATYLVKVNVKDETGKIVSKTFEVLVTTKLVNNSTVDTDLALVGETITITGAAVGGTGEYSYAFYYKKASSKVYTLIGTEYGTDTTAEFIPYSLGDYDVRIRVKDSSGTVVTKKYTVCVTKMVEVLILE